MEKKKSIGKGCLIATIVGVAIFFLLILIIPAGVENPTTESVENSPEEQNRALRKVLEGKIKSFDDSFDGSSFRGTVESMSLELAWFGGCAKNIIDGENSDDEEINRLAKQLKEKVSSAQAKEFPLLRKEYAKITNNLMWEHDIEVYVSGDKNKYINFTGGIFAANKNKKEFQNEIHEVLKKFRFTQSRYRWYKGANEYTYYTIYEGRDADIVEY
jgi:hypothetical protein